jgi:hypothetical protein
MALNRFKKNFKSLSPTALNIFTAVADIAYNFSMALPTAVKKLNIVGDSV